MRLVACLFALALLPTYAAAEGALYLDPPRASYKVGETFVVHVRADTAGTVITAAEADLTFDPNTLSVEGISVEGSILGSFSTEPSFSNTEGRVSFSGWTTKPYQGSDGHLLSISFRALRAASNKTQLVAGAALALEQGSNIIETMRSGLYTVGPREVIPDDSRLSDSERDAVEARDDSVRGGERLLPLLVPTVEVVSPITVGERIIVRGVADPRTRVWIRITGPGLEGESAVISGVNGAYEYISGAIAEEGLYRVIASSEGEGGLRSESSDRSIVEVGLPPLAARLSASAGFLSSATPFIALLIIAGFAGGLFLHRRKRH